MDADVWHIWCTTQEVTEPPALTVRQWNSLSPDERASRIEALDKWLRQIYLETEEWAAVAESLTRLVKNNANKPRGTKDIIVLTGPNLIGKSTLMMRWGRTQSNVWTQGAAIDDRGRPIIHLSAYREADLDVMVWIDLRGLSRTSTFDRKINNFFGLPSQGTTDAIGITAENAFKRHGTLCVIVDDTHLAWLDRRLGRQVLDHIKHLNTELGQIGATLILVGANLEDTELVDDPQISGRLKLLTLQPYEIPNTAALQKIWQRVVKQLEDLILPHLPAAKPGFLFENLAGELWHRSNGYPGHLVELVIEATLAATRDGAHRITRKHLDTIKLSDGAEKERQRRLTKRNPSNDSTGVNPVREQRTSRSSRNAASIH
jgi:hypothetical protein